MKRMPDGIDGELLLREERALAHAGLDATGAPCSPTTRRPGAIDYLMVDDLATLLFVANLGCIEMHPLHSRCDDVHHPDYLFFDLDPFEPYTYEDVLAVARHVNVVLRRSSV